VADINRLETLRADIGNHLVRYPMSSESNRTDSTIGSIPAVTQPTTAPIPVVIPAESPPDGTRTGEQILDAFVDAIENGRELVLPLTDMRQAILDYEEEVERARREIMRLYEADRRQKARIAELTGSGLPQRGVVK
jgi:hypothetical protein